MIQICRAALLGSLLTIAGITQAAPDLNPDALASDLTLQHELGVDFKTLSRFRQHPAIVNYFQERLDIQMQQQGIPEGSAEEVDPLTAYETWLPHATQPDISNFEKAILTVYLNHPDDLLLTNFLAAYHARQSLLIRPVSGKSVEHSIIALYFFNRIEDLGGGDRWVGKALTKLNRKLDKLKRKGGEPVADESDHPAYDYFIETFNYHEENRYIAADKLMEDFVAQPNNAFTSFGITAVNTWNGGETDYEDPTVLYNSILGAWFAAHTIDLAKAIEQAWEVDPENNVRFRLGSILGGFSAIHRKWLATLNHDSEAASRIDDEHRIWTYDINMPFHAFTLGVDFFQSPENFLEGYDVWTDTIDLCLSRDDLRTCHNKPRFSFNALGFNLGWVDYLLKAGEVEFAGTLLSWMPYFENYAEWDYGHDAVNHRVNNLQAIADLYANDDPSDDPLNFFLKRKQWGTDLSACQTCHQAQSKVWTEEEKNTIMLPPEEILTIGDWPEFTTTWYGAVK
ncbi:hypothetical protein BTA51_11280 [Hahella sp. CCB-MM4]|uniref:hypothetical protein n=1 Tax=Hahella sp. (strain CCB-MM4) TaxID=1926491 RepID=UPI000B9C203B|nr:hypothetical protein [Hahella sp. CCB-MM4]OZG73073.1 hypothetical protein BTA51_11280 [Hahella sp. CCB-MM4]